MKAIVPFKTGQYTDCQIGTLVGLQTRTGSIDLAIVLSDPASSDQCRVLILQDRDGDGPVPWFEFHHSNNECFIFGNEWIFELLPPEDGKSFCDTTAGQRSGGVLIKGNVAALRVGRNPHDPDMRPAHVDVISWEIVDQPYNGLIAASDRWKVWASEAQRTREGGKPLLSFNCTHD